MEKAAKIILASVMSSAAIISGVSFFALDFTGEETTHNKAGISGLDETSFDLNKRWIHTPVSESHLGHTAGTIPFYEFDFPQHVKVGEEFEINIPYTFVKIDPEDGDTDEMIEPYGLNPAPGNVYAGTTFSIKYPQELILKKLTTVVLPPCSEITTVLIMAVSLTYITCTIL